MACRHPHGTTASHGGRHAARHSGVLTRQPSGDRLPEPLAILTPRHRRPTRRPHRRPTRQIPLSPAPSPHRNSSLSRCCDDRLNPPTPPSACPAPAAPRPRPAPAAPPWPTRRSRPARPRPPRDGQPRRARLGGAGLVLLAMAVPFLVVFLADHPRPTRQQGSGGDRHQVLRTAGQPTRPQRPPAQPPLGSHATPGQPRGLLSHTVAARLLPGESPWDDAAPAEATRQGL